MGSKKNKKGFTLIELMVAMAIFSIVLIVAVGAFINMNNLRAVAMNSRESQQKLRMALEIVTRYSKQADRVVLTDKQGDEYKEIRLFFNTKKSDSTSWYGIKFKFEGTVPTLNEYECSTLASQSAEDCIWGPAQDLLGGEVRLKNALEGGANGFHKNKVVSFKDPDVDIEDPDLVTSEEEIVIPTSLYLRMNGIIDNNNMFYQNDFDLETRIILENIR